MLRILALTPLMICSACGPQIDVGTPPPPDSYLTCEALPPAPSVSRLQAIPMPDGMLAYPKADVDARDAEIARFIVSIRGAWFDCSNQLERVSDYYDATE